MTLVNTAVWHIYTWKREWKPTPVFLPGEFHGESSLASYCHEVVASDTTEQLTHSLLTFHTYIVLHVYYMCINIYLFIYKHIYNSWQWEQHKQLREKLMT